MSENGGNVKGSHELAGFRKAQRAEGLASVLAIGTANPPGIFFQSSYPDFYFDITNSSHKTELKENFKRMCKIHYMNSEFVPIFIIVVFYSKSFQKFLRLNVVV